MTWRAIQDTVALSKSLAGLSHGAERLYWRMLAYTDPHGRLEGDPVKVRVKCLPLVKVTDAQVDKWMDELQECSRILRYLSGGRQYVQVLDFEENQPADFLRKRGKSKFPDPPPKTPRLQGTPGYSGTSPEKGRLEGEGEGEELSPNGLVENSGDERRVYDHWRRVRHKTDRRYDRISDKRRQKIRSRLREGFSADDLCRALDAVALDPWEDRPRHDDLTVLFRSREKVDEWLELADRGPRQNGKRGSHLSSEERERLHIERLRREIAEREGVA